MRRARRSGVRVQLSVPVTAAKRRRCWALARRGTNAATSEQFFLGRVTVTIRAGAENANFRVIVGRAGRRFDQIVATTTFGTGTSEFSDVIRV